MSTTAIVSVCGIIMAIGGALACIGRAISAIQKPQKENERKFEHIYECLTKDKDDIVELRKLANENREVIGFLVRINLVMLKHLESGNDTGEMRQTIHDVEEWLIERGTH